MEPYAYSMMDDYGYKFVTDQGNEYSILFSRYWQQDLVDVYGGLDTAVFEFYFEVISRQKTGMDKRIPHTIFHILEKFLTAHRCVVFYITQRDDGRGKELFKVYQFWHALYRRLHNDAELIDKIDKAVAYGEVIEAHLSCMYLKTCFADKAMLGEVIERVLEEIYPNAAVSVAV